MKILNYIFSFLGYHLEKPHSKSEILNFIKILRPYSTEHKLVRLGGNNDGGYLVPDDLNNIKFNLSPGIGNRFNFELDLLKRGIPSNMCDASIDSIPRELAKCKFIKKNIGSINKKDQISINDWIEKINSENNQNLMLQMDIEGMEYETILSLSKKNLDCFRIIIIEFHNLREIKNKFFFKIVLATFEKLLENFIICHIHPNNSCGINYISDVAIPNAIEVSFIRKDRVKKKIYTKNFPHPLDQPSVKNLKDIFLPKVWFS
jgi:hypothetical protein